jgi:alkanesulfonate monooxygenase SsuD/methylene tetrahydromethanopterin reductase-like flavin-dependent oxidoreductase (luciferase family)
MMYDHVLGADPAVHAGWERGYDVDTTFHEPMVALGYLAGVTSLELVTGVLVLPQRQTALVAKQAAELDLLTGGRLRLGVGLGWNGVEYEALGPVRPGRGGPGPRPARSGLTARRARPADRLPPAAPTTTTWQRTDSDVAASGKRGLVD